MTKVISGTGKEMGIPADSPLGKLIRAFGANLDSDKFRNRYLELATKLRTAGADENLTALAMIKGIEKSLLEQEFLSVAQKPIPGELSAKDRLQLELRNVLSEALVDTLEPDQAQLADKNTPVPTEEVKGAKALTRIGARQIKTAKLPDIKLFEVVVETGVSPQKPGLLSGLLQKKPVQSNQASGASRTNHLYLASGNLPPKSLLRKVGPALIVAK